MRHGRTLLVLGEGLDRIRQEDLLGLLHLMKLSLSVWNHLSRVGRGRALTRSGICLVVKRLGGWRGLLVI
jgi:hypothetical protein